MARLIRVPHGTNWILSIVKLPASPLDFAISGEARWWSLRPHMSLVASSTASARRVPKGGKVVRRRKRAGDGGYAHERDGGHDLFG